MLTAQVALYPKSISIFSFIIHLLPPRMENSLLYKPLAHQNKNLQPSEDGEQDEFLSHRPQTRKNTGRSCFLYCTISILILIAYSVLLVIWTQSLAKHNRRYGTRFSASETPADDFIFYETREMEQWEGGMDGAANEYFTTPPNEEVDKNWHNLMESMCLSFILFQPFQLPIMEEIYILRVPK